MLLCVFQYTTNMKKIRFLNAKIAVFPKDAAPHIIEGELWTQDALIDYVEPVCDNAAAASRAAHRSGSARECEILSALLKIRFVIRRKIAIILTVILYHDCIEQETDSWVGSIVCVCSRHWPSS